MSLFSFPKYERLKSRKDIETLFRTGKAFFISPLKIIYLELPSQSGMPPIQFGVSAPKRNFKRAVDRNLIKRRIRAIYRTTKSGWLKQPEGNSIRLQLWILYNGKQIPTSAQLTAWMAEIPVRLEAALSRSRS